MAETSTGLMDQWKRWDQWVIRPGKTELRLAEMVPLEVRETLKGWNRFTSKNCTNLHKGGEQSESGLQKRVLIKNCIKLLDILKGDPILSVKSVKQGGSYLRRPNPPFLKSSEQHRPRPPRLQSPSKHPCLPDSRLDPDQVPTR